MDEACESDLSTRHPIVRRQICRVIDNIIVGDVQLCPSVCKCTRVAMEPLSGRRYFHHRMPLVQQRNIVSGKYTILNELSTMKPVACVFPSVSARHVFVVKRFCDLRTFRRQTVPDVRDWGISVAHRGFDYFTTTFCKKDKTFWHHRGEYVYTSFVNKLMFLHLRIEQIQRNTIE